MTSPTSDADIAVTGSAASESAAGLVMPAAFFGHGNPMNALDDNRYTAAWRAFGQAVPRPRAILVVSAHWYINATAVTAMPRPRTIHDFYGFPRRAVRRRSTPRPGCPSWPPRSPTSSQPTWVGADVDSWGIDHGTWSVLVHAFPDADDPRRAAEHQRRQAAGLPPRARREAGTAARRGRADRRQRQRRPQPARHGLAAHRRAATTGHSASTRTPRTRMLTDPTEFAALDAHGDYGRAVPTPDHFIPALYLAGLADAAEAAATPTCSSTATPTGRCR